MTPVDLTAIIARGEDSRHQQYQHCMAFIKRNLHHVQGARGFNSPGHLEIPEQVFEEILVNALVHRDYFISAPIRLLIFADRIEITSPGHLPNHLDTEQIRYGLSNLRNPALASHAFHILPYQGLGSGIPRIIEAWPQIEFQDDRKGNQFRVIIRRNEAQLDGVNGGVNGGVNATPETLQQYIVAHPGQRAQTLAQALNTPLRTIERWLKQLRQAGTIEFIGPPKPVGITQNSALAGRNAPKQVQRHQELNNGSTIDAIGDPRINIQDQKGTVSLAMQAAEQGVSLNRLATAKLAA